MVMSQIAAFGKTSAGGLLGTLQEVNFYFHFPSVQYSYSISRIFHYTF